MLKTAAQGDGATVIALKLIAFLASDADRLERFCALSGLLEQDIKGSLQDPDFLGFVFDYVLQDESLLLAFAADEGLRPETVVAARRKLPGFSE